MYAGFRKNPFIKMNCTDSLKFTLIHLHVQLSKIQDTMKAPGQM